MLDVRYLAENKEEVKNRLASRGEDYSPLLDEIVELYETRRKIQAEHDSKRAHQKELGKQIGLKKSNGEDANDLIEEMGNLPDEIKKLDSENRRLNEEIKLKMLNIPNIPHESVPVGESEEDNAEVRRWGEPPQFGFQPKDHVELGVSLGILDFERAAKIARARFTLQWGAAALMERALIDFMLDIHTREHGYKEVLPPFLTNRNSNIGTGNIPKFEGDLFHITDYDLFLVPTAEVPVTNIHREEILSPGTLPRYYAAYTPCFRSEAGAAGKDTRGMIRQHQFQKVELVKFVEPETSYDELEKLTANAEEILKRLNIHYRVVTLCTGDMGFASAKTYDIEVWLPGQGAYREISSCSNFRDFQARRANIRYRAGTKSRPRYVHTLNGSGLATGRTLIAILENYQQEDGSVVIPEALRSYMHGMEVIEPPSNPR